MFTPGHNSALHHFSDQCSNDQCFNGQCVGQLTWRPLFALFVIVALLSGCAQTPPPEELDGLQRFEDLAFDHVPGPVAYAQTPPVGGAHSPLWQNCGIYDQPIANEQAVHSLEHGAIWITYRPDLVADDVARLRELVRGRSHALLSPYPQLPAPVVASAWGVQLQMTGAADPRLPFFVDEFHQGAQTPEPGAPCRGGVGEPMSE